jgi:hypothetical protein
MPRSVKLKHLYDGIARRLNTSAWTELSAAKQALSADYASAALRECMTYMLPSFPELAWPAVQVTATDGLVAWTDLETELQWSVDVPGHVLAYQFFNLNPDTDESAREYKVKGSNKDGVQLADTSLASVWAVLWRKLPDFTVTAPATTTHALETVLYDSATGVGYLAIIADADDADLTDTAQWAPLEVPEFLLEPCRLLAASKMLGHGEQERQQKALLEQEAIALLYRESVRQGSN